MMRRSGAKPIDVVKANASLLLLCERALARSGRARGAGSRQQVRAAARRFVRRHRRDASYLAWVLRSVGTNSALAIALLGVSAAPTRAELLPFAVFADVEAELHIDNVGPESTSALGDLDGDGDLDAITGNQLGTFRYDENAGHAANPDFTDSFGEPNPLAGQDVGFWSTPALGDLDADGDLDLVAGGISGTFRYYENTGGATTPAFADLTGAGNPLDGEGVGQASAPALGDLDGDGDLDVVSGEENGTFFYYENTGTRTSPVFVLRTDAANPLAGQDVGIRSKPSLADLDSDGDLDLVAGEVGGALSTFENTGDATRPAFVPRTGAANPLAGHDVGDFAAPTLGDLDADGDPDLVVGRYDGNFSFFEHFGGRMIARAGAANPLGGLDASYLSTPTLGDLDGDGDLDIVAGESTGTFFYFENTGGATQPAYLSRTGSANPLDGYDVGGSSAPALGDFDGDGDLDMLSGAQDGVVHFFTNTGSATSPAFVEGILVIGFSPPVGFTAPALGDVDGDGDLDAVIGESGGSFKYLENLGTGFAQRFGPENPLGDETLTVGFPTPHSAPALGDLDGDGDVDLISGDVGGGFTYYENTGIAGNPAFVARRESSNPPVSPLEDQRVGSIGLGSRSKPALGDLDGDGDLDLVVGEWYGLFHYFENFVAQIPPHALELAGGASPLDGEDVGALSAPALADLDGDGDLDLVAGEDLGTFSFFENTGSAIAPGFAARTDAANPLAGRDVGDDAKPAFADLDGDGDLDLLAGNRAGDLTWFANTGDATTPMFAAAAVNPFGLSTLEGGSAAPAFGDLDADGDLDLVVGTYYDTLQLFENTGTGTNPAFSLRTGVANPFGTLVPSYYATPALADFDLDGDLDLILGREHGRWLYFANTSSPTSSAIEAVFAQVTGARNPLFGEDVGDLSAPAAGDLNGDGTPDLVTGALSGTFAVHYLPEPSCASLLAPGAALLRWLERRRRASQATRAADRRR